MKPVNPKLALALLGSALLVACGSPGVPIPPSLELPRPVSDLRASRKGDTVTLTWSMPTKTTDQRNIRHRGTAEICRDRRPMKQCVQIAQVPFAKPTAQHNQTPTTESHEDHIPASLQIQNPLGSLFYAISVENSYKRTAGLSNQVQVPVAPTLPAPTSFRAQLSANGVRMTWNPAANAPEIQGLRFVYRLYRHDAATKKQAIVGEVPISNAAAPEIVDTSFDWERTYEYYATIVTLVSQSNGNEQQIEGDNTPTITVIAHDVFPPATPTGVQAVFSGPGQEAFIDLVWNANTEGDFAGYNVYRREEGATAAKINSELIKSPAFRDTNVVAGHTYFYSVSAVDVRGNESPRSEESSETVPAQ